MLMPAKQKETDFERKVRILTELIRAHDIPSQTNKRLRFSSLLAEEYVNEYRYQDAKEHLREAAKVAENYFADVAPYDSSAPPFLLADMQRGKIEERFQWERTYSRLEQMIDRRQLLYPKK